MRRIRIALLVAVVGLASVALTTSSVSSPASASAALAPPTATTGAATNVAQSSATVSGTVNPNGTDTHYYFQYGTTTSYGANTPAADAGAGVTNAPVSANLTGLSSATTYHFRLVALSSAGTTDGADQTFTTTTPPGATTGNASKIARSSAVVDGTVNPNGQSTTYYFRYGTTTAYGLQSSPSNAGSGSGSVGVHASIYGLTANTLYHYQLVTQNAGGTSYGVDQTLTTTSSEAAVLGHEGFVSPGGVIGVEIGCFHGTSACQGHVTMTAHGSVIGQRNYSIPADSGGFQNMKLTPTGEQMLQSNYVFHLLGVAVNVTGSTGQQLSYTIHLARWVWH